MKISTLKTMTCRRGIVRLLSATVLAMTASLLASADEPLSGPALRVHLQSGDTQVFLLAKEPVITFADDNCHIASDDFSADYKMSDIHHADFVKDASAGIAEQEVSLVVDLSDPEAVTIHGLDANATVSLYSLAGIAERQSSADSAGTAIVSLAGLQSGIYVVSTNQTTFKIFRK